MNLKAKFTTKANHFLAFFEEKSENLFFSPNPFYSFELPKQPKTASSLCEKSVRMPRPIFSFV
jgi:hypothetical protein